jgi:hypothetical protein
MGYRQNVLNNTTREKDPYHPRHYGITMQAHHLLSKKGVQNSGLSKDLEHLGYDINHLKNISLIPSTLSGACHLNIQVHRGNHGAANADASDDDGQHKKSYHIRVQEFVEELESKIDTGKYCDSDREVLIRAMNKCSRKMVSSINSNKIALTKVYKNFGTDNTNRKGCSNQTSISSINKNSSHCLKDRDHTLEGITFPKQSYKLEVGR